MFSSCGVTLIESAPEIDMCSRNQYPRQKSDTDFARRLTTKSIKLIHAVEQYIVPGYEAGNYV
jgi:hypothetical protein